MFKIDNQNIQKMSRVIILPVQYFEQVEKYMNDFEDDEEGDGLRALYETILRAFVLADEPSVCNIHISAMVNKIAGIQTNPTITSFKQMVDRICTNIFKDIFNTQTYNQQQKIRKMVTTIILFRMKASICNNPQYDGM